MDPIRNKNKGHKITRMRKKEEEKMSNVGNLKKKNATTEKLFIKYFINWGDIGYPFSEKTRC